MSHAYIYDYFDENDRERSIEVNYTVNEDREFHIEYLVDPSSGNEILPDELDIPVEEIYDALDVCHKEDDGDEY
jgi:hypothetical protein